LLIIFAIPCFAELTEKDISQIRQIIREEIEPIKIEIVTIKGDIKALEGKMATKDDIIAVNQKLGDKIDTLYGIIIASFVTLIVVIAIPQILIAYRERRESRLSKEVDELKQRVAELERKRIVT
jgi:archaellum component FlaC